ncbi:MAG: LOG family protein [Deltaproteobacteria bacterium]|nr:LOG family protein [Deltaproteobacteria bacterium]
MGQSAALFAEWQAASELRDEYLDRLAKDLGYYYRVCAFGSARTSRDHRFFKSAQAFAQRLAEEGIDVLTGGGNGMMRALNEGARNGGCGKTRSLAATLELRGEEPNEFLDRQYKTRHFDDRFGIFHTAGTVFVALEGGIGTAYEIIFTAQKLQLRRSGKEMNGVQGFRSLSSQLGWTPLLVVHQFHKNWLRAMMDAFHGDGMVDAEDNTIFTFVRSNEEAADVILRDRANWRKFLRKRGAEPMN